MAQVYSFNAQSAANKVVEQVKKRVAELSKMHPAAKVIMGVAAFLIIAAAIYTGYHNY